MLLLVGLGNPGRGYADHRHNIGFMAVDEIVRRHSFAPFRVKFQGLASAGTINREKVVVLKPQTFMNESGRAVGEAVRFFKLLPEQVLVIYDELDLPPGKLRVKRGGGHGGHNGLRSLDAHIGKDYRRVRLGIGHPGDKNLVSGYVLHDFAKADQAWRDKLIDAVSDSFGFLVAGDDAGFMNRVALATQPPRPKKPPKKQEDETEDGI